MDRKAPYTDGSLSKLSQVVDHFAGEYRPIGAMTYDVLREGIVGGSFRPGSPLRQADIARAIGVSRNPVRAALIKLADEGLVTLDARGAARARVDTSALRIEECYAIREVLEPPAFGQAIDSITDEGVKQAHATADALAASGASHTPADLWAYCRAIYGAQVAPVSFYFIRKVIRVLRRANEFHLDTDPIGQYEVVLGLVDSRDGQQAEQYLVEALRERRESALEALDDA